MRLRAKYYEKNINRTITRATRNRKLFSNSLWIQVLVPREDSSALATRLCFGDNGELNFGDNTFMHFSGTLSLPILNDELIKFEGFKIREVSDSGYNTWTT